MSGSRSSNNKSEINRHLLDTESTTLNMDSGMLDLSPDDYFKDSNLVGQLADSSPEVKQSLSEDYNQLDEPILDTLKRDFYGIYNKMKIIALPLSSYEIYKVVLRGWDLWGPLLLCTFLAFNLHHSEYKDNHTGPHFADVFVLVWFGSCIVSLNYRLLSISSVNNQVTSPQQIGRQQFSVEVTKSTLKQPMNNLEESSMAGGDNKTLTKEKSIDSSQMVTHNEATFQTLMSPPSIFQLMCVFGYCLVAPCLGLVVLKIFSFSSLFFERIIIGLLFGFAWPTFCSVRILIRYQHPEKRALAIYPIGLFYFVLSCIIIVNH